MIYATARCYFLYLRSLPPPFLTTIYKMLSSGCINYPPSYSWHYQLTPLKMLGCKKKDNLKINSSSSSWFLQFFPVKESNSTLLCICFSCHNSWKAQSVSCSTLSWWMSCSCPLSTLRKCPGFSPAWSQNHRPLGCFHLFGLACFYIGLQATTVYLSPSNVWDFFF